MKNVLICGAGMSATDLISYMLKHAEEYNWEVTVGDILVETAKRKIGGHPRGKAVYFDCYDAEIMEHYIKDADIVISLLPPGMHAAAAKIALRYNAHVVTASYASQEMIDMHEEAKEKGITFLNELSDEDHPKLEEIKQACQTIHLVLSPSKQKKINRQTKQKSLKH